jgi:hypothetical protein
MFFSLLLLGGFRGSLAMIALFMLMSLLTADLVIGVTWFFSDGANVVGIPPGDYTLPLLLITIIIIDSLAVFLVTRHIKQNNSESNLRS